MHILVQLLVQFRYTLWAIFLYSHADLISARQHDAE